MEKEKKGLSINTKSFITALIIIFCLMLLTYILTFIIPGGEYARKLDEQGNLILDTEAGYREVEGGIPFWKWILSPFLLLGAEGSGTILAVIAFLLVIGGIFNALDKCGLMKYMLSLISSKFGSKKYRLLSTIILFFMAMGSLIGSFEEVVPLVPIACALAISLGWDAVTGIAMSILATGCGFAAGVFNPFTVGVAQTLAKIPMFSGFWLRLVSFVLIYGLLLAFVTLHAKKVEKKTDFSQSEFVKDEKMSKALLCFGSILGGGIVLVFLSAFITFLRDYTMIIVAVMFLVAGVVSVLVAGFSWKTLGLHFKDGAISILPAVLMILMASSIKYTLTESKILDTVLNWFANTSSGLYTWVVILFIYLVVLVMNFFIPSGSAKAFLLIPLIVPIAQICGISTQLCIVAYAFGDGFSNVFYPTNPVLLISLGVGDVSYAKWVKWSWKFQASNLLLTCLILLFGLAIGY